MKRRYPFPDTPGLEPKLSELLADPVMHTLLAYDGLTAADVLSAVTRWQQSCQRSEFTTSLAA